MLQPPIKKQVTVTETSAQTGNDASLSVGFIGAGMMASALADGIIDKKVVSSPSNVAVSDVYGPARENAAAKGMRAFATNQEVCQNASDVVVLAVKPGIIKAACVDITEVQSNALVISIAAGVTLKTLEDALPNRRVVRVMPNTPCLVGEAACGFSLGALATKGDKDITSAIFKPVGMAMQVDEKYLDAVTGLSGSGPAYVYQFIEAMSDGGVRCGLPRDIATKLAAQTVKGAAEMVLQAGKHPGLLKDAVTSPGGTTIAGVEALEKGGLRATTMSAVMAATKRSMQIGGMDKDEIENKHGL
mmetsp:Transcript_52978/g.78541  ORF Transcript_52978/g.78541 Transcript_52978/m.78541 type:complete len:302 (+) Transcript_52978:68-973(+)|eukprot:CAMPEP_0195538956 /NCGR_PEP_ID=MMETSP0794_2-20130614/49802_1 /TAXON_ID=515487 /ORGANISM="Stephanopyxis turris, Strain CCMP 815" /LENGTH=301 /DNA_ID=CAMNT_0040672967 /DNA_START=88 /DNA_END=993 /DNA_ORIENTATION=+